VWEEEGAIISILLNLSPDGRRNYILHYRNLKLYLSLGKI